MDVKSQFFIKGIENSLKEASFRRDLKRGVKDTLKRYSLKELKRSWRYMKKKPGETLAIATVVFPAVAGAAYLAEKISKYHPNSKKSKHNIKEAAFWKDYKKTIKQTFKNLTRPKLKRGRREIKRFIKFFKRRPGYVIGRYLPPALAITSILGLSALVGYRRNKRNTEKSYK
jgi:hypothetical protein